MISLQCRGIFGTEKLFFCFFLEFDTFVN
uniref:Uncharacterized protein n=1 Tax=Anguilla anguilla TaxID=7936 RepID=A0A0E9XGI3_ANGAN